MLTKVSEFSCLCLDQRSHVMALLRTRDYPDGNIVEFREMELAELIQFLNMVS